jgi:hypothetical protein
MLARMGGKRHPHACAAGGNVSQCNYFGKQYGGFFKNLNVSAI